MKKINTKYSMWLGLLAFTFVLAGNAEASTAFDSQASIGFSIASIPTEVSAVGSFAQTISYSFLDGDGVISDANSNAVFSLGENHVFAVGGNAGLSSGGSVASSHLGGYQFQVTNNSATVSYTIDMQLNYDLAVFTSGEFADSDIVADFSDQAGWLENVYVYAATYDAPASGAYGAVVVPSFSLAPGEIKTFYADVVIGGNLYASPVPLPAAAWLFLSGLLGVVGVKKRRITNA